ncbi:hypothetical protein GMOD_00004029 [Pyrenophora seminiperda CCB06]|uniref:Uncharacterized protein n=1 Tax=Pyrenophora seminiperda CCB06 TaxID=1302712 RepID=A0A3M7M0L0_9PLEO|nr:hypothetical protein GMOD_00004029 [Pyrenophora seminiperda CCB06]
MRCGALVSLTGRASIYLLALSMYSVSISSWDLCARSSTDLETCTKFEWLAPVPLATSDSLLGTSWRGFKFISNVWSDLAFSASPESTKTCVLFLVSSHRNSFSASDSTDGTFPLTALSFSVDIVSSVADFLIVLAALIALCSASFSYGSGVWPAVTSASLLTAPGRVSNLNKLLSGLTDLLRSLAGEADLNSGTGVVDIDSSDGNFGVAAPVMVGLWLAGDSLYLD